MKSKERFIEIMDALREQYDSDLTYSEQVGEAMGVDFHPYNNNALVNCLVQEMASWFDDVDYSIGQISHFMYEQDFGRMHETESNYVLLELWEDLNSVVKFKDGYKFKRFTMPFPKMDSDESPGKVSYTTNIPTGMHNSDVFGNYVDRDKDNIDSID